MLSDYQKYRIYEILPGLSIWLSIFLMFFLTFTKPLWLVYFIIIYDIYWVLKVFNFSVYLIIAWRRLKRTQSIDWFNKILSLDNLDSKRHIIFLTVYNEEWNVVEPAIRSVTDSVYDKSKFTLVIAGEERKKENFEIISSKTKEFFGDKFNEIVCVMHPMNLLDEIPGKGSNMHYAEREMHKYVDQKGWNYDNVIVTIFDIDTVCDKYYFSYLTYLYCTNSAPTRTSYQPVALYNNNMWESPSVLRVMAFGTTFWLMTALAQQDSLVTFSSHSMSFRALVDAGFHDKRIVSEDSRIFYQCFLAYNGDYKVTPMYIPVSMDTVRDDNWWESIKNLYKQQRRWAWGVEHVPYLIWEFKKKGKLIPRWKKIKWIWNEWEGKWSWSLVAIIITFLPRLPLAIASDSIKQSALYFNAPFLLQYLITGAMMGLLLSALLSFPLLPKVPKSHPKHRYITIVFQWLLLPFSMIFVSAIPAIDAVTHLMFGKYLGFNVSQKKRK
ncbi:MAG: glycosyltransferase family 2 protein [bacterium]|nr:glycosyltransferase family 2 protein [bacterium]